jgi:hypothetical protein
VNEGERDTIYLRRRIHARPAARAGIGPGGAGFQADWSSFIEPTSSSRAAMTFWSASRSPSFTGYTLDLYVIAFPEPPSDATWLENALFDRIFRVAK